VINGSNFGTTQGTSTVRFGTMNATISSWANTVTVPNVTTGSQPVTVTVNDVVSNSSVFTVTTVQHPNYTCTCPATPTVNRNTNGAIMCTLARTGGFTGSVWFSVSGLPTYVTAAPIRPRPPTTRPR
jgi:hypothetical protein